MTRKSPNEFTVKDINDLEICVYRARLKIEGDKSFDKPDADHVRGNDWDPVDNLNVYFDTIVKILNTAYTDSALQQAQSKVRKEFSGLVEATKAHVPYLTEKYESAIQPRLYDINHIKNLIKYVNHAKQKLEGNNSFDIPASSGHLKDDGLNPVDQLNAFLDTVVEVLHKNYHNSEHQQLKSKLDKEYSSLIAASRIRAPHLTEKYESALKPKENNKTYFKDQNTNLNNLV